MSNKVYDVLKWISLVFLPALITFAGVIMKCFEWQYADIALTIAVAFNTFLGTLLGISNLTYKNKE